MLKRSFSLILAMLLLCVQAACAETAVVTTLSTTADRDALTALLGAAPAAVLYRLFNDTRVTGAAGNSGGSAKVHLNGSDIITFSCDQLKNALYLDSDVFGSPLVLKGVKVVKEDVSVISDPSAITFSTKNINAKIFTLGSCFSRSTTNGITTTTITLQPERLCDLVKAAVLDLKDSSDLLSFVKGLTGLKNEALDIAVDLLETQLCSLITDYIEGNVEISISSVKRSSESTAIFSCRVRKSPESESMYSVDATYDVDEAGTAALYVGVLDEQGEGYMLEATIDGKNVFGVFSREGNERDDLATLTQKEEDDKSVYVLTVAGLSYQLTDVEIAERQLTGTLLYGETAHEFSLCLPTNEATLLKLTCEQQVCLAMNVDTASGEYTGYGSRRQKPYDLNKVMTDTKTFNKWYSTVTPGLEALNRRLTEALTESTAEE